MYLKSLLLTLMLASVALAAGDANRSANLVILNETAVKNLNLATEEASEADFEETIFALGRIRVAPGHRSVISSRVPGRAISVSAHIDRKIEKGAEALVLESRQPGDPPPSIRLVAPAAGYISAVNVAPGQPVSPDDSLVEILDLSSVHAVAAVPEHLAHKVQLGQKARIRAAGYPDQEFTAEVEHLGATAVSATGTIEVSFHVENPDGILRPDMRAEFSIVTGKREGVMSVPIEAVQGDGLQRFVYAADFELKNAYLKSPVVLGAQNDRMVEIVSGLLPGDQVVTRGGYALIFAGKGNTSLKEALDAAHGHAHADDGSELGGEHKHSDEEHAHESGGGGAEGFTPLTTFFAGTTALLFLLVVVMSLKLRRRIPA